MRLGVDELTRVSAVLGIHKVLRILYADSDAENAWLRGPHAAVVLGGDTPLAVMTSGPLDALLTVRRFLDGARGGLYMAPNGADELPPAPRPSHRLVPSQFPPIAAFDAVATADDLAAVMELEGWTDDRLVADRAARLPRAEWVFGRPNASVVEASFLHVAPGGMRFNGPDLGAWYAGATLNTGIAEVAHHLRREAVARGLAGQRRRYRAYLSMLDGDGADIRGQGSVRPELYDATSYAASQIFGEALRATGRPGLLYDSLRLRGGVAVAGYRPSLVLDVRQSDHLDIAVSTTGPRIDVARVP